MCDTMGKLFKDRASFAKNSDRSPNEPQVVEYFPPAVHEEATVKTTYIEVEQVKETYAFVLSRPTWLWGGEMGVNEHGVCIGNEAVFTKGKYNDIGLTGMDMVRLALERSKTAKEALECIIGLLEKYGQGGNCGFDHEFLYDNSFLIMDRTEIYILETAGKEWVFKKCEQAAISNRLSIGTDGDVYSEGSCDFAKKHLEPVYSHFSQSKQRKAMCQEAAENAECLEDLLKAMRQHADEENPMCKASVGSPCMHYGGLVGDHTTQSMAVELLEDGQIRIWTTGQSLPCVSFYKPFLFGNEIVAPIFEAGDEAAMEYWMQAERFKRRFLGKKIPAEYYTERDAIEKELMELSQFADAKAMEDLSKLAIDKEIAFFDKWRKADFEKVKVAKVFKMNWEKKNKELIK